MAVIFASLTDLDRTWLLHGIQWRPGKDRANTLSA